MDPRRREKIKTELQKAEEYLRAAELLHKNGLMDPAISSAYFSSIHASIAAFLTSGSHQVQKENFSDFKEKLDKFNLKLDPFVGRARKASGEWAIGADIEHTENEVLLRIYQSREFLLEVKDFLRRTVRF